MNTVVMPTSQRPEMLALSLEQLRQIPQRNLNLDVRIFLDFSSEERVREVEYVRDTYFPEALIFHAKPHIEVPSGMWNILNSLKQGYQTGAEYVYLVEEDVLVRPDFFDWHRSENHGEIISTCGRRMRHLPEYSQYTNPGSCFRRDKLGLIVPHINDEMFSDRRKYFDKHFGPMDEISDLDDGLIRRIAKYYGLPVKYPDTPKCSHIGFRAYNHYMNWTNTGTIEQRIQGLRKILKTVDLNNRYTADFEPIDFL